jgi:hypothetical protein
MEKRTCDRIDASLEAKFFCNNFLCTATITNLSEKGMCINTGMCLPCGTNVKLLIPVKEEILEVPVEVKRAAKREGFYDTMGLELLNPPQNYLAFVDSLRPAI